MAITTEMIKQLREATGAGILDCRKALEQADGDYEKAVDFLREKGLAQAAKRADRTASEGVVELYSHGKGRVACDGRSQLRDRFRRPAQKPSATWRTNWPCRSPPPPPATSTKRHPRRRARARERKIADRHGARRGQARSRPPAHRRRLPEEVQGRERPDAPEVHPRRKHDRPGSVQPTWLSPLKENIVIRRFVRWELGEGRLPN